LLVSLVYVSVCRLFALVVLLARGDRSKELEILVLRHELSVLRRQVRGRPRFEERDRLVLAALSRTLPYRAWGVFSVRPETLLRWPGGWSPAAGRIRTGDRAGHPWSGRCAS
jgi:putative transposase